MRPNPSRILPSYSFYFFLFPSHDSSPLLLPSFLALSQLKLGRQREGFQTFGDAIKRFPLDKALQDAYQLSVKSFQGAVQPPPQEPAPSSTNSSPPYAAATPEWRTPNRSLHRSEKSSTNSKSSHQKMPVPVSQPLQSTIPIVETKLYKQRCREAGSPTITVQAFCEWLSTQPGGEIRTQDMSKFYAKYPELRTNIGKVSRFCQENSDRLCYEFREKVPYVRLRKPLP